MKDFRNCVIIWILLIVVLIGFHSQSSAEIFVKPVTEGWNLVGLSFDVPDKHYLSVFPTAMEGTLWGHENGVYGRKETMEFGKAYWLRFPEDDTLQIVGNPLFSLTIDLDQGWNMISGISVNVPLSDVIDPGNIIVPGTLLEFDGSQVPSDTIETGKGYWIKAGAAGQITLSGSFVIDGGTHEISTSSGTLMILEETGGGRLNVSMTELQHNEIQQTYGLIPDLFIEPSEIHRFRFSPDENYTGGSVNVELRLPAEIFPDDDQKVVVFSNKVESVPEFENNVDIWDAVENQSRSIFLSFEIFQETTNPLEFDIGLALPAEGAQEFNGTIVDTLDNPVKGAYVYHVDTNVRAITRQNGNFILYVKNVSSQQLNYKMAKSESSILLAALDIPLNLLTKRNSSEMLIAQGIPSPAVGLNGNNYGNITGTNLRTTLDKTVFDKNPCELAKIDVKAIVESTINRVLEQKFILFNVGGIYKKELELSKNRQAEMVELDVKLLKDMLREEILNDFVPPEKRYIALGFWQWLKSKVRLWKDHKDIGRINEDITVNTIEIGFALEEIKPPEVLSVTTSGSRISIEALEGGTSTISLAEVHISTNVTFHITQKKSGDIECKVDSQVTSDGKFAEPLEVTVVPYPGKDQREVEHRSIRLVDHFGLSQSQQKNKLHITDLYGGSYLPNLIKNVRYDGSIPDQENIYAGKYLFALKVRDVVSDETAEVEVEVVPGETSNTYRFRNQRFYVPGHGYNPKFSHEMKLTFHKRTPDQYDVERIVRPRFNGNLCYFIVPSVPSDYEVDADGNFLQYTWMRTDINWLKGEHSSTVVYDVPDLGWFWYDPTFVRTINLERELDFFSQYPEFSSDFYQELTRNLSQFQEKESYGIQLPITGSIVRGDVPIFGYFQDGSSNGYRIEYGKGVNPTEWNVLEEGNASVKPVTSHDIRLFNMERTVEGNLATWATGLRGYNYGPPTDYLEGIYTVRLCKLTEDGPVEQQRVILRLGSVVANALGRKIISDDGKISLSVAPHSLPYPAELFYIEKLKNTGSSEPYLNDYFIIGPPTLNAGVVLGVENFQEELMEVEQIDIETGESKKIIRKGDEFLIKSFGNAGSVFRIRGQPALQSAEILLEQGSKINDSSTSEELNFLDFEGIDKKEFAKANQLNPYLTFDFSKGKDSFQGLRITNEKDNSPFKVHLPFQNVDADSLPLLEFDYKMEDGSQVDLYITVDGKHYVIGMFSGEPKFPAEVNIFPVEALHSHEQETHWQHARIDLARVLRKNGYFDSDSKLIVENIFLAGLESGSFMQLYPLPNPKGASISLDNMYLGPFLNNATYQARRQIDSLQNVSLDDTAPAIEIEGIEKMASGESFAIKDTIFISFVDPDGSDLDEKSVKIKLNGQPLAMKLHYRESDARWAAEIALQKYCSDNENVSLRISDVKDRAGNMADETVAEFTFRPDLDRTPPTAPKLVLPSQHEISNQIQAFYCISSDDNPIAQYQWRLITRNGEYAFTTLEPVKTFDFSGLNGTDLTVFLKATDANGNESPESRFDFVINVLGRKKLDLQSPINVFSPREAGDFLAKIENLENKGISIKVQDVNHAAYATIEYAVESDFIVGNNDLFISGNYRGNTNIANIYLQDNQSRFFVDLENYIDVGENEDFYASIPLKDFVLQGLKLDETRKLSVTFEWENIEGVLNIYEMGFENNLEKHPPVKLVEHVGK